MCEPTQPESGSGEEGECKTCGGKKFLPVSVGPLAPLPRRCPDCLREEDAWICDGCGKWSAIHAEGWEQRGPDDAGVTVEWCPHCKPPVPTQPLQGSDESGLRFVVRSGFPPDSVHNSTWRVFQLDPGPLWKGKEIEVAPVAALQAKLQRVEAERDSAEAAHAEAEDELLREQRGLERIKALDDSRQFTFLKRVMGERAWLKKKNQRLEEKVAALEIAARLRRAKLQRVEGERDRWLSCHDEAVAEATQVEARIQEAVEEFERRAKRSGSMCEAVWLEAAQSLRSQSSSEVGEATCGGSGLVAALDDCAAANGEDERCSCPDCKQEDPAARRERAVNELLEIAKLADDSGMAARLEALASRFSYPPGAVSPSTPRDEEGK